MSENGFDVKGAVDIAQVAPGMIEYARANLRTNTFSQIQNYQRWIDGIGYTYYESLAGHNLSIARREKHPSPSVIKAARAAFHVPDEAQRRDTQGGGYKIVRLSWLRKQLDFGIEAETQQHNYQE